MTAAKKQQTDNRSSNTPAYDPVAFQKAMMLAWEEALPVLQEFAQNYAENLVEQDYDPFNIREAYTRLMNDYLNDPQKYWNQQAEYWQQFTKLWKNAALKMLGEKPEDTGEVVQPQNGDRRFKAPEWQENAVFDFIKQSYLLTCAWMEKSVQAADGLSEKEKEKLAFTARQLAGALSPTNFPMTNPEVIRETIETGGKNLIHGFENLIEDLKRSKGALKISTTDYEAFKVGENLAATKGDVIFQNELMQLIQYAPSTGKVFKRPLLVIPPWINKYYILDLRPDNSFVKWAVDQGHTVFMISWVNPDKKLKDTRFDDYMESGLLEAINQIEKATGESSINAVGYCLGGTLLTATLSYLKAKGQEDKIASATMLTTLTDFEHAGELKLFMDDEQLAMMDKLMKHSGVLEAKELQKTFSLLRANDLIWSFVVNNYLLGREPFPFDLLYWNDDSTNMPAEMHSFYLRSLYRDNLMVKPGGIKMKGIPVDLGTIKTPIFMLSTREDHIAPWKATYALTQLTGGPVKFTLAASGHIAGVVNSPAKNKYCYWSADKTPKNADKWLEGASQSEGSWWPAWQKWISGFTGEEIEARKALKSLEPAPGSYVRVKG